MSDLKRALLQAVASSRLAKQAGRLHRAVRGNAAEADKQRVRAWLSSAAPEAARPHARLVMPPTVTRSPIIDVIIPVYRDLAVTRRCIESAVAAGGACEIVVIDDASPEPAVSAWLDQAAPGRFTLLRNETNLGFVQTVNRGMRLHPDRDVVLLNSDTVVSGDWLARLERVAYSSPTIGTVTPLSNSATICSYPRFCEDNALPEGLEARDLDGLFGRVNAGVVVDVPTGVGFCMYVKRACLADVGLFDAERWGKGYGEENDFCMRAAARDWRSVAAAEVFVQHVGGASFGGEKAAKVERAVAQLDALYPHYLPMVRSFVAADPLLPARRAVDLARLGADRDAYLLVSHSWGGGTQTHVDMLATRLEAEGVRALVLQPTDDGGVRLGGPALHSFENLRFRLPSEYDALVDALKALRVKLVHVHHTVGVPAIVGRLSGDLGVPYDYTLHDYFAICPRLNLIGKTGSYCGEPEVSECNRCVASLGSPVGRDIEVGAWRDEHAVMLGGARNVFVPHEDVAERLGRYFPKRRITVRRHFVLDEGRRVAAPPGDIVRVAVIGAIGPHKGFHVLERCASDAQSRGLPLHFVVVGYTCDDAALAKYDNVTITGKYDEARVYDVLEEARCQVAFLPSLWPETYAFTLSIALRAGLWPVVFDLGAMAARLHEASVGDALPLEATPARLNDALVAAGPHASASPKAAIDARYGTIGGEYYV